MQSPLEKLANLLNLVANIERRVEITRQVLVENRDFDAVKVFRHLDIRKRNKISKKNLQKFLEDNEVELLSKEMELLFDHLDRDGDNCIDWEEFIKTVISKDCSFYEETNYESTGAHVDLKLELRHSLARVFEEEVRGLMELDRAKEELFKDLNFDIVQAFKTLDVGEKSYIDIRDIYDFVSYQIGQITYSRAEKILRRLDIDLDGRIIFQEWEIALRPRCLGTEGGAVYDKIIRDDEWALEQKIRAAQEKTAKKILAQHQGKHDQKNTLKESRISITPTRIYRRKCVKTDEQIERENLLRSQERLDREDKKRMKKDREMREEIRRRQKEEDIERKRQIDKRQKRVRRRRERELEVEREKERMKEMELDRQLRGQLSRYRLREKTPESNWPRERSGSREIPVGMSSGERQSNQGGRYAVMENMAKAQKKTTITIKSNISDMAVEPIALGQEPSFSSPQKIVSGVRQTIEIKSSIKSSHGSNPSPMINIVKDCSYNSPEIAIMNASEGEEEVYEQSCYGQIPLVEPEYEEGSEYQNIQFSNHQGSRYTFDRQSNQEQSKRSEEMNSNLQQSRHSPSQSRYSRDQIQHSQSRQAEEQEQEEVVDQSTPFQDYSEINQEPYSEREDTVFEQPVEEPLELQTQLQPELRNEQPQSRVNVQIRSSTPEKLRECQQQREITIKVFKSPATKIEYKASRPSTPLLNMRRNRNVQTPQCIDIYIHSQKNKMSKAELLSPHQERSRSPIDYRIRNTSQRYRRDGSEMNREYEFYTPNRGTRSDRHKMKGGLLEMSTTAGKLAAIDRLGSRSRSRSRGRQEEGLSSINEGSKISVLSRGVKTVNEELYGTRSNGRKKYTSTPYNNLDYERIIRSRPEVSKEEMQLEGYFNDLDAGDREELINSIKELLDDNKELEECRTQLSLRFDFNVKDLFRIAAGNKQAGYLNSQDIYNLLLELNIPYITGRDADFLLDRFDKNKDEFLDFNEFVEIFCPFDFEYRTPLLERESQGVKSIREYTGATRKKICKLVHKILVAEKNLDFSRSLIYSRLFLMFNMIDIRLQGLVTVHDLSKALAFYGVETSRKELCALIDKLDHDFDGMISFEEFIEFFMPKKHSSPIKRPGRLY